MPLERRLSVIAHSSRGLRVIKFSTAPTQNAQVDEQVATQLIKRMLLNANAFVGLRGIRRCAHTECDSFTPNSLSYVAQAKADMDSNKGELLQLSIGITDNRLVHFRHALQCHLGG